MVRARGRQRRKRDAAGWVKTQVPWCFSCGMECLGLWQCCTGVWLFSRGCFLSKCCCPGCATMAWPRPRPTTFWLQKVDNMPDRHGCRKLTVLGKCEHWTSTSLPLHGFVIGRTSHQETKSYLQTGDHKDMPPIQACSGNKWDPACEVLCTVSAFIRLWPSALFFLT